MASQLMASGTMPGRIVPGQECHRMVDIPVRYRNAGIGQSADAGGNTRNDAKRDIVLNQRQRLFAPAPEDEWIPTP